MQGYEQIKATANQLKNHLKANQTWTVIYSGKPRIVQSEELRLIRESKKAKVKWLRKNSGHIHSI